MGFLCFLASIDGFLFAVLYCFLFKLLLLLKKWKENRKMSNLDSVLYASLMPWMIFCPSLYVFIWLRSWLRNLKTKMASCWQSKRVMVNEVLWFISFVNSFCGFVVWSSCFVVNRKCLLDFLAWIGSWALTGLFSLVVSIVCLFLHLFLKFDLSMDVQLRSWFEQTTRSFSCPARVRTACWGYNSSMILMTVFQF